MPTKHPEEIRSSSVQLSQRQLDALERIRVETGRGGRAELVRIAVDAFIVQYDGGSCEESISNHTRGEDNGLS